MSSTLISFPSVFFLYISNLSTLCLLFLAERIPSAKIQSRIMSVISSFVIYDLFFPNAGGTANVLCIKIQTWHKGILPNFYIWFCFLCTKSLVGILPFALIHDFRNQNTRGIVSKIFLNQGLQGFPTTFRASDDKSELAVNKFYPAARSHKNGFKRRSLNLIVAKLSKRGLSHHNNKR